MRELLGMKAEVCRRIATQHHCHLFNHYEQGIHWTCNAALAVRCFFFADVHTSFQRNQATGGANIFTNGSLSIVRFWPSYAASIIAKDTVKPAKPTPRH